MIYRFEVLRFSHNALPLFKELIVEGYRPIAQRRGMTKSLCRSGHQVARVCELIAVARGEFLKGQFEFHAFIRPASL